MEAEVEEWSRESKSGGGTGGLGKLTLLSPEQFHEIPK